MNTITSTYEEVLAKANGSAAWYVKNQKWMKRLSKIIRLLSIVLFGLGGLIPMINSLLLENQSDLKIVNLGYIAIAIAGTLLLVDKFFGFSSGWIRFITANMEIERMIVEFEMRWKIETFGKDLENISEEEGKIMLTLLMDFVFQINEVMKQETNSWVSEFQSNLAELQESISNKTASTLPGNIKVNITNTKNYDNLKIRLDNNLGVVDFISPIHLFREVKPGYHQITVSGESIESGKSMKATEVAHVEAGKLAEVTVDLEV